jgi:hypothetical protein
MPAKKLPLMYFAFLDHGQAPGNDNTPWLCELVGWVYKTDKDHYYVVSWCANGKPTSSDSGCYIVVKGAVKSKRRLR